MMAVPISLVITLVTLPSEHIAESHIPHPACDLCFRPIFSLYMFVMICCFRAIKVGYISHCNQVNNQRFSVMPLWCKMIAAKKEMIQGPTYSGLAYVILSGK